MRTLSSRGMCIPIPWAPASELRSAAASPWQAGYVKYRSLFWERYMSLSIIIEKPHKIPTTRSVQRAGDLIMKRLGCCFFAAVELLPHNRIAIEEHCPDKYQIDENGQYRGLLRNCFSISTYVKQTLGRVQRRCEQGLRPPSRVKTPVKNSNDVEKRDNSSKLFIRA
jgi:hypothetical protein